MSNRFLKYIPSEKSAWLRATYPFAYLLLSLIAERARRTSGHIDGMEIGQALIGDHCALGATRQQYRTALKILEGLQIIRIHIKSRNGRFSTIKTTIKGTLVTLLKSDIWDINSEDANHQSNHQATIKQPSSNHEQERNKNEEETSLEVNVIEPVEMFITSDEVVPYQVNPVQEVAPSATVQGPIVSGSFLFHSKKEEDFQGMKAYLLNLGVDACEDTMRIWFKKFSVDHIVSHAQLLMENERNPKARAKDHTLWMEAALRDDYIGKDLHRQKNFEMVSRLKKELRWHSLKMTKSYCRDESTGNDYQFKMNSIELERILRRTYTQQQERQGT